MRKIAQSGGESILRQDRLIASLSERVWPIKKDQRSGELHRRVVDVGKAEVSSRAS